MWRKLSRIKIITFLLLLIMISTAGTNPPNIDGGQRVTTAYVPTSPIDIEGNAGLSILPGAGTSDNPYQIRNMEISGDAFCIRLRNTTAHVAISYCALKGGTKGAIILEDVKNVVIEECTISSTPVGINLERTESTIIYNNELSLSHTGVSITNSSLITIGNSRIYHNVIGIEYINSSNSIMQGNSIFGNNGSGIVINEYSTSNRFYYNKIGWNGAYGNSHQINALDNGKLNVWDDGSVSGNQWSDYNGTGAYDIWGEGGGRDRHPTELVDETPPEIIGPDDLSLTLDTPTVKITWLLHDEFPRKFQIVKGTTSPSTYWSEGNVSIDFTPQMVGTFIIKIVVTDHAQNTATDEVNILVLQEGIVDDPAGLFISTILSAIGVVGVIVIIKKRF